MPPKRVSCWRKSRPAKATPGVNYIKGVVWQFQKLGLQPQGADLVIQGNVPQGAGLSSSAALEVAAALLLDALHGWGLGAVDLVKLAQKAENEFVGVACGIMDQFASMLGQKDHALFLDCRSLEYEAVPLPLEKQGYAVAVVNSGVRRAWRDRNTTPAGSSVKRPCSACRMSFQEWNPCGM